ncbi:unsaturated chondroitin disaccharide hydrolase [Amycolatopsis pretoriensis]|uniref:Unsaturated chondroitin disaccharide hydrolase n=1 Tax=Amycolatopsis pretoriensis TaxID=218821 RepID=A0A1H5RIC2_9PSEU|nr:glycoside hydrolase family 88 protein [Amycolatopsis pretoriensis]SEF38086.1 unsaturated chondroitin disaccharide hydrolase [Amycolatopsis pretoriensis]
MDTISAARALMLGRLERTLADRLPGFPHFADPRTGEWTTTPDGDWTGGHFVGQLWLAAARDERFLGAAREYSARLDGREHSPTIFRGFLFHYGALLGGRLVGDEGAWDRAVRGAEGLMKAYNPAAGLVPLGTAAEEAHSVGDSETSIDAVGAVVSLLTAVADRVADPAMTEAAASHALRHIEICVRSDGSVCQSGTVDADTGAIVRRYSHKGFSAESTWARAQAWAMLAFAMAAHRLPGRPELLYTAIGVADWWSAHVPDDLVAYWDFDDPGTVRDTSSTAIAAAALLKLAELVTDGEPYRLLARRTVQALIGDYMRTVPGMPPSIRILGQGCYNKLIGLATAHELVWGDYYLTEALSVLAGELDPLSV